MIKSLTSLRGIFILFIFFHHCLQIYPGGGTMAVAFFFVLGGFSMTLGYKDKVQDPNFRHLQYLKKRCIKFYPLHWITLLASIPLIVSTYNLKFIPVFFVNAALLQSWIPIGNVYMSFNYVSWYLADTIFFAVVFPFVFRWIAGATTKGKVLIAAFLALMYIAVAIVVPDDYHHAVLYVSPYMRLTDFIVGIYLALGYLRLKARWDSRSHGIAGPVCVLVLIALLVVESCLLPEQVTYFAPVYWPLITLLILAASLFAVNARGNWLENKYLVRFGELSFVFFMIHQLVLRYATGLFENVLQYENDILYVSLTLLLTIALSLVIKRYVLNPITLWLTTRNQQSMIARS